MYEQPTPGSEKKKTVSPATTVTKYVAKNVVKKAEQAIKKASSHPVAKVSATALRGVMPAATFVTSYNDAKDAGKKDPALIATGATTAGMVIMKGVSTALKQTAGRPVGLGTPLLASNLAAYAVDPERTEALYNEIARIKEQVRDDAYERMMWTKTQADIEIVHVLLKGLAIPGEALGAAIGYTGNQVTAGLRLAKEGIESAGDYLDEKATESADFLRNAILATDAALQQGADRLSSLGDEAKQEVQTIFSRIMDKAKSTEENEKAMRTSIKAVLADEGVSLDELRSEASGASLNDEQKARLRTIFSDTLKEEAKTLVEQLTETVSAINAKSQNPQEKVKLEESEELRHNKFKDSLFVMASSLNLAAALCKDPELARMSQALQGGYQLLSGLSTMAVAGMTLPAVGLVIAGLCVMISAFSEDDDTNSAIMEMLSQISHQIYALHKDMLVQFAKVFKALGFIHYDMMSQFALAHLDRAQMIDFLKTMKNHLHQDLDNQNKFLIAFQRQTSRQTKKLEDMLTETDSNKSLRTLAKVKNRARHGYDTPKQYDTDIQKLHWIATQEAARANLNAGHHQVDDWHALDSPSINFASDFVLNNIQAFQCALNQFLDFDSQGKLVHPRLWLSAQEHLSEVVSLYSQAKGKIPQPILDSHMEKLEEVRDAGLATVNLLQSLDVKNNLKKLLAMYPGLLDGIAKKIQKQIEGFCAEWQGEYSAILEAIKLKNTPNVEQFKEPDFIVHYTHLRNIIIDYCGSGFKTKGEHVAPSDRRRGFDKVGSFKGEVESLVSAFEKQWRRLSLPEVDFDNIANPVATVRMFHCKKACYRPQPHAMTAYSVLRRPKFGWTNNISLSNAEKEEDSHSFIPAPFVLMPEGNPLLTDVLKAEALGHVTLEPFYVIEALKEGGYHLTLSINVVSKMSGDFTLPVKRFYLKPEFCHSHYSMQEVILRVFAGGRYGNATDNVIFNIPGSQRNNRWELEYPPAIDIEKGTVNEAFPYKEFIEELPLEPTVVLTNQVKRLKEKTASVWQEKKQRFVARVLGSIQDELAQLNGMNRLFYGLASLGGGEFESLICTLFENGPWSVAAKIKTDLENMPESAFDTVEKLNQTVQCLQFTAKAMDMVDTTTLDFVDEMAEAVESLSELQGNYQKLVPVGSAIPATQNPQVFFKPSPAVQASLTSYGEGEAYLLKGNKIKALGCFYACVGMLKQSHEKDDYALSLLTAAQTKLNTLHDSLKKEGGCEQVCSLTN